MAEPTSIRGRLLLALPVAIVVFAVLTLRLVDLSLRPAPGWLTPAPPQEFVVRGDILDSAGNVLATSVPAFSLFVNPRHVRDVVGTARSLAEHVDIPAERIEEILSMRRGFVWVKRQLPLETREAIEAMRLPGVGFRRESRRVYPYGALTAHIVGVVDIDGNGLSGIEFAQDERLREGLDVELTLDTRIQSILREELAHSIERFSAIGGAAIVLDIETGELKGMVSNPDFMPRERGVTANQKFNRAALGVYELGSTMKVVTAAIALEEGIPRTRRYPISTPLRIGRFAISDFEMMSGSVSLVGMVRFSSNIASAKIALDLGAEKQRDWLDRLGLTQRLQIGIPESGRPLVPSVWRPVNVATISFGHGIATTPLNLASAVATIIGTGERVEPTLIRGRGGRKERLFSPETVETMRAVMRLSVTNGTGRRSDVAGYEVGGKTGTSDKATRRGYDRNRRLSSFIGAFPMSNPRYVVYVMVDEPKPRRDTHGFATGGWVAAPAVGRIVSRLVGIEGLLPVEAGAGIDITPYLEMDRR